MNFDLGALIASAGAGYQHGFAGARIDVLTPGDACFIEGAPDLVVQMLDKLVENAADFCSPAGKITVQLRRIPGCYEIAVGNDGPPIPDDLVPRLFESLFEHRPGGDDKPHFGLGLYIVRLIAEFHGGRALAANREDGSGAVFRIVLPLI